MHLSDLKTGESGIIVKVLGHGGFRKRILEMGFVRGQEVTALLNAPLRDPIKYKVMDYEVSLRRNEAAMIEIVTGEETVEEPNAGVAKETEPVAGNRPRGMAFSEKSKEINIALVGNPNSGKTSLFNALAGRHEHVGNYSGVTVDAKSGHFNYKGYKFNITDLPGTYAITAYSPEEVYVRRFLMEHAPDVILNAVVASNLERNLYLTTELIDINQKTVVALNMYDELEKSGARLDYVNLGKLTGIPMVPVIAKEKVGLEKLLDTIIAVYESDSLSEESEVAKTIRHIHIKYSPAIEKEIALVSNEIKRDDSDFPKVFPPRYWSIKLLEGDRELYKILSNSPNREKWDELRNAAAERIKRQLGEDVESAVTNEKYGFISGALKETFVPGAKEQNKNSAIIDSIVTHKVFSFPIFLLLMWIMFYMTYTLGAYPQEWLENLMGALGNGVSGIMSEGPLRDLIVDGIIGGVGSVVVFLPNILILYLFISLMEDSGYMARAAFIMDKLMHKTYNGVRMQCPCNNVCPYNREPLEQDYNHTYKPIHVVQRPYSRICAYSRHLLSKELSKRTDAPLPAWNCRCSDYGQTAQEIPLQGRRDTVCNGTSSIQDTYPERNAYPFMGKMRTISQKDREHYTACIHNNLVFKLLSRKKRNCATDRKRLLP